MNNPISYNEIKNQQPDNSWCTKRCRRRGGEEERTRREDAKTGTAREQ
jgi:hypothetical protein